MKKALFFVLCILFSAASFAQEAFAKIKHIESLKQELSALLDDEERSNERKNLRTQIREENFALQNTVFTIDSGEDCFSFELSKNSFSVALRFDSEEIFRYEGSLSNLEAAVAQSAHISFKVRAKENLSSEYEVTIFEISVFNQNGRKISQKSVQETRNFAFLPKTDVDWEHDEIIQKTASDFVNLETSSKNEIDFQAEEQIDWNLKDERTFDINLAYNCYWNGYGWQGASLSLALERSIYDKHFFFGGNLEAGSDNPLVPIAWILSIFGKDDDSDSSNSKNSDKNDDEADDDYEIFAVLTGRAGFLFPFSKSLIFRIFGEAGFGFYDFRTNRRPKVEGNESLFDSSAGAGGGSSLIFYKYTNPGGYVAWQLEYAIFCTSQMNAMQRASVGFRLAF